MIPDFTIRSATVDDLADIVSSYHGNWSKTLPLAYTLDDLCAMIDADHVLIWVARDPGLVGLAIAFDMVCWGYLDILWVAPQARRRSIGSTLLVRITNLWDVVETAFLDNETGNFLRKRGFKICNEKLTWAVRGINEPTLDANAQA